MKITDLRIRRLHGTIATDGPFWEDRQVSPLDIYDDHRDRGPAEGGEQVSASAFRVVQLFLEITADDGTIGLAGPLWEAPARVILQTLRPMLLGADPLAIAALWDRMHRALPHGRQGDGMLALSAVDCALWDLKGKALGQPVWRLLGGPTRDRVPAYASMLGFAVDDLDRVRARALEFRDRGYTAQKWFFRHGPASGFDGMKKNVALVRTLREALGEDYDLMFDCWQSMDFDTAVKLCDRIEDYRPRWIEEVFMADRIASYVDLRQRTRIPIAGGEHDYTRWGALRFLQPRAVDVLQPDIYWSGGLSEMLQIAALASAHDVALIPHGHSTSAGMQFSLAQSPSQTPLIEYLVKWNAVNQHFLKAPPAPECGGIASPLAPGMAMTLDPDKIEGETPF